MASVLVVFASTYGQTSKIAEHAGEVARHRGHLVRVIHVDTTQHVDVASFDAVIVLAPVYYVQHPKSVREFVTVHLDALARRRTAFISVSIAAASRDPIVRRNARRIAYSFPTELDWHPDVVTTAGGAIAYPRYNFVLREIMKRLTHASRRSTDPRRVLELTEWSKLDADLATVLEPLEATRATPARIGTEATLRTHAR